MAFWRTNSLPNTRRFSWVNGVPSHRFIDDTRIQIITNTHIAIPSRPKQNHEPNPVDEATSDAANTRENIESSLKQELYAYALQKTWHRAKSIYDKNPDMVRIPLTASGDTALHVAVSTKSTSGDTALHVAVSAKSATFVEELVELMTPKDLEIQNTDGNTAFCMAAITGNSEFFQIMISKNQNLPVTRGHDGMLPVHLAVLTGYHKIVQDLCSEDLLRKMDFKDIEQLFFMTINSSMYDVATKLLENYPEQLIVARDDMENQTALHMLARKPSEEFYMRENNDPGRGHQLELLQKLWARVRQLEYNKIVDLITHPSVVLFDAVKSGKVEVVKWILYMNRELLKVKDPENGRNILHFAVMHRQHSIFKFILKMGTVNLIIRAVDNDRNNVLHFVAHQPEETSSNLRANILMQRELAWFKEVEQKVPRELRTMRNKDGKTPKDIFHATHIKLSSEVKDAAKGIANSGMVVATLIATVAFAAALTVPGDKTSAAFIVFILTNAVALFTSSASIVSFLSIFTSSRFTESAMIISLHPSLIVGLTLLFISIATMVIAFAAASFLIFDHIYKWVAYVVASLGVLPILMFLVLQFSLFDGLLDYFFWSRYYRLSEVQ